MTPAKVAKQAHGKIRVVEDDVPGIMMRDGRHSGEQILEPALPMTRGTWHFSGRRDRGILPVRLKRVDPRVAVGKRLRVWQGRNAVQLNVIVRIDQSGKDQVVAQIEAKRMIRRANHLTVRKRQWAPDDAIVLHDVCIFEHDARPHVRPESRCRSFAPLRTTLLRAHRSLSDSVHTHFRQISSRCMSRPCRHARASAEFRIAPRLSAE